MNIDKLSDRKKSATLLRLAGLVETIDGREYVRFGYQHDTATSDHPEPLAWVSLYEPKNMALAWRVHLWTNEIDDNDNDTKHRLFVAYYEWWRSSAINCDIWNDKDWQRSWLDKILSLAIESGLVKGNE